MKRQQPQLNIDTEPVRVHIDQYECFAELGYINFFDIARIQKQKGYQRVMEYIARTARDGDRLAAIELGGNPIADIAEEKSNSMRVNEPVKLPFPRPRFNVTRSNIKINYKSGKISFNAVVHPVRYRVTPHRVEIYLRQYPSISIEYEGIISTGGCRFDYRVQTFRPCRIPGRKSYVFHMGFMALRT